MSSLPKLSACLFIMTLFFGSLSVALHAQPLGSPAQAQTSPQISTYLSGLDHPTLLTFDDRGRVIVLESTSGDPPDFWLSRIEARGVKTRLTSAGVFGKNLPVTSISYTEGRVYVVHGAYISSIKPDGTLDTVPLGKTSPASSAGTDRGVFAGIDYAVKATGPDGETYLTETGSGPNQGAIWRTGKPVLQSTAQFNLAGAGILIFSILLVSFASALITPPIRHVLKKIFPLPKRAQRVNSAFRT